jgi:hypothetical protein
VKINRIERYVSFIGWGRSGNSLIGALLDFHPNIFIKNEFFPMQEKFKTQEQIFETILEKIERKRKKRGQGWGSFRHSPFSDMYKGPPIVVGGKKGGKTSNDLHEDTLELSQDGKNIIISGNKKQFDRAYDEIIKVPVKWIHVQRNPYDNITTMRKKGKWTTPEDAIKLYFWQAQSVEKILKERDCISIRLEDVIQNTEKEVEKMCNHLEIPVYNKYLNHCRKVVWKEPRRTRHSVKWWTPEKIEQVKEEMKKYNFMEGCEY